MCKPLPYEIAYFYASLTAAESLFTDAKRLGIDYDKSSAVEAQLCASELKRIFDIDSCAKYRRDQVNENLFNEGIDPALTRWSDCKKPMNRSYS